MNMRTLVTHFAVALLATTLFGNVLVRAATIHIIVGPSNHPPGTHEVAAGARLLKHCLDQVAPAHELSTVIHEKWPDDPEVLVGARALVFCGDQFPPVRFKGSDRIMEQLSQLADNGSSFVAIHYAIGVNRPFADSAPVRSMLDQLFGGFANFIPLEEGGSVPRILQATILPKKSNHPVVRGVKPFSLHDEPYYKNRFPKHSPDTTFTPLATAMIPPEAPKEEVVAWSLERANGGRGMAIVMPHFYRNWQNADLRKLVLNGIVWSAGFDIPETGIPSTIPDLADFKPLSVDPIAR
jgi:type 1 glutamine amidotransferase